MSRLQTEIVKTAVTHQLFADDLKLLSTVKTSANAASLQSAFVRMQQWYTDWQLTIILKSALFYILAKLIAKYNIPWMVAALILHKMLPTGVEIDCNIKYDTHVNNIIGKAYARVGVLFHGFASRNLHKLRQGFITHVRPVLEYASSVWAPYLLKHINAIKNVQKRFTKRTYSLSHLSYPERLAAIILNAS